MSRKALIAVALIGGIVSGCASGGQTFRDIEPTVPALKPSYGRIFFTRDGDYQGSIVQPDIRLNGEVVGPSKPGGFFYVDRPAGQYTVSVSTEVENKVEFRLNPGETKYIKTAVSMGILIGHVTPTLIFPEQGASDIRHLTYIGKSGQGAY